MQINFTDAERSFADSAAGQEFVLNAYRKHLSANPNGTAFWSDAHRADAIRRGAAIHARSNVVNTAAAPRLTATASIRDAARMMQNG